MPERILGLVGPGEGGLVCTRVLGSDPVARITGLCDGGEVEIQIGECVYRITENGTHVLQASDFMRVRSKGSPHMICTLLSGSKRAVS